MRLSYWLCWRELPTERRLLLAKQVLISCFLEEFNILGTQVRFDPGVLHGGIVEFDCGTSRCISYYLEALLLLSPFCKSPLNVKLLGVTNAWKEISVDAIRATWLTVFNKFVLNDENLGIKVHARGFLPDGGGSVTLTSPIVKTLRPAQVSFERFARF